MPYINGNPSTGTMGSIPPAASIEYDQREIVAVIQYAYANGLIDFNNQVCLAPSNSDLTQLLKAIFGMTNQRKMLADTTIYINATTGDDTLGDGSVAKPYRTYQIAVNNAQARFDLSLKHVLTFHGTGAFTSGPYLAGLFAGQNGPDSVVFDNTNATFNVVNSRCFWITGGAACRIIGGTYSASTDGVSPDTGIGLEIGPNAIVYHSGGMFLACGNTHLWIDGYLDIIGTYTIAANAPYHMRVTTNGIYTIQTTTGTAFPINLSGTPNFSSTFCAVGGGSAGFGAQNWVGAATGVRYTISNFGSIYVAGAGANALPGNAAGSIAPSTGAGTYS